MSGLIPRLEFEELKPDLAEMLRPRVERLGYLGEFFKCAGHQPQALMSFMQFTEDLKHALPDRLTEVVALTVATVYENTYERIQHERLSLKLGFGESWVRGVSALKADGSGGMSKEEILAQRFTLAVLEHRGHNINIDLEAVIKAIGHEQAIAILMLIGRYVTHALIVNSLNLPPPIPSPLAEK
jgi:alkylhydroperoxidase family enzyme